MKSGINHKKKGDFENEVIFPRSDKIFLQNENATEILNLCCFTKLVMTIKSHEPFF